MSLYIELRKYLTNRADHFRRALELDKERLAHCENSYIVYTMARSMCDKVTQADVFEEVISKLDEIDYEIGKYYELPDEEPFIDEIINFLELQIKNACEEHNEAIEKLQLSQDEKTKEKAIYTDGQRHALSDVLAFFRFLKREVKEEVAYRAEREKEIKEINKKLLEEELRNNETERNTQGNKEI